jgi:hypothetical protein
MESAIRSRGFEVERLEQRRLLCGALLDAAVGHASGVTEAPEARSMPADAEGHLVAAFARANGGMRGGRVVWGETAAIDGATVATWAIVSNQDGRVMAAGATIPLSLAENQPQQSGSGPAGAIASLDFPAVARASTYFNHLELHTQPNGHPISPNAVNPNRYRPAHFDFHFYGIGEDQVRTIPPGPPVAQVPQDRLPAGYAQPGPSEPQMGRHSGPASELTQPGPFSAVMIAGFTPQADQMHFLEPMVTREVLLRQENFTLPMPMPQTFDRDTRYPTSFQSVFQGNAHHFIFSDFIDTAGGGGAAAALAGPTGESRGAADFRLQPDSSSGLLFADSAFQDDDGDDESPDGDGRVAELLS